LVGGDAVQVADRFLLRMSIRVIRALGGPPTVSDADPIQPRLHVAALPYPSARPPSIGLSGPVLAFRVLRPNARPFRTSHSPTSALPTEHVATVRP
jgi:hypothetical protein